MYNDIGMIEQDFTWLNEHGADLIREYAGKWIAVAGGNVVGVGDTATQASAQASEKFSPGDFILEHVDAEVDVVYELS